MMQIHNTLFFLRPHNIFFFKIKVLWQFTEFSILCCICFRHENKDVGFSQFYAGFDFLPLLRCTVCWNLNYSWSSHYGMLSAVCRRSHLNISFMIVKVRPVFSFGGRNYCFLQFGIGIE